MLLKAIEPCVRTLIGKHDVLPVPVRHSVTTLECQINKLKGYLSCMLPFIWRFHSKMRLEINSFKDGTKMSLVHKEMRVTR